MTNFDDASPERSVSDRWVRIFVAAANTGSFTRAARMLGMGQPAVSHAIKRLEKTLGVALFERDPRGLTLTVAGEALRRGADAGLRLIDDALTAARLTARSDAAVALSVSTALATHWLMPRVAAFKERHPDVELSVITQDTDSDVGHAGADLWIPLGAGPWGGMRTWRFADERIVPVASPGFVEADSPVELTSTTLLHLEERYGYRYDWARWFDEHGLSTADTRSGQRSNDYSIVIHAALEGQGVALGWLHIVEPLIASGRLVALTAEPQSTDQPFVIVARRDTPLRDAVEIVRGWLLEEAADQRR